MIASPYITAAAERIGTGLRIFVHPTGESRHIYCYHLTQGSRLAHETIVYGDAARVLHEYLRLTTEALTNRE